MALTELRGIKTIAGKLISLLKICLFSALTVTACNTYAISFRAYGSAPKATSYHCRHPYHHYHQGHRQHRRIARKRCCDSNVLSVYYFVPVYPCGVWGSNASCPGEEWGPDYVQPYFDNNERVYWTPSNDRYDDYDVDWNYNPDLATGDDDQNRYPDMNSQY
jgi:hypothetical protein